jgi:hypothetical protein
VGTVTVITCNLPGCIAGWTVTSKLIILDPLAPKSQLAHEQVHAGVLAERGLENGGAETIYAR